ncbi:MAG: hypothetical protein GAK35_04281 [Herbaspirillum frisingense]|uniref:TOBE domain-containing protein n=1 Tax=Herbaspirillum frisingense TaxID=92645 RepID=A0A7V8FSS1_9BURK|nr:MAG: hypothetical protein GAK35_04281 [Herbaspirillum frisingense]
MLSRGFLGDSVEYLLHTPIGEIKGMAPAAGAVAREGQEVPFSLPAEAALLLPA